jgi:serine/threonine protein kinase
MTDSLSAGRYTVHGVLGEGGQGVTLDAFDNEGQRFVAIKRFDVRGARSWKDVELAEREARVLATIDHPLVPRYVDRFEQDGALYLVMERIDGETLDSIRLRGPVSEDEVQRFLACADRVFTYLHGRAAPVVHRDVKPRNVIRRPDGSYVFADFGAVSESLARRGGSTVVGTLGYMAPEQLQGRALPATDIYAVGATALAALTGVDPEALPHRGLRIDVRAATGGRVSESLVRALEKMLEPDPDVRAKSLAEAFGASGVPSRPAESAIGASGASALSAPNQREDTIVRSLKKLLWVLWGLSWVIVPATIEALHLPGPFVPVIMFGSLAALLVATWHKAAFLRAGLRALDITSSSTTARERVGPRVEITPALRAVRVEATADTEREVLDEPEVAKKERQINSRS